MRKHCGFLSVIFRQVGDQMVGVQHVAANLVGSIGYNGLHNVGGVFSGTGVLFGTGGKQLLVFFFPTFNLFYATAGIFVQRNIVPFDQFGVLALNVEHIIFGIVLAGFGAIVTKMVDVIQANLVFKIGVSHHFGHFGFTAGVELPETLQQPVLRCAGAGSLFEEMKHCRDFENGRSAFLAGKLWELLALLQEQTEQQTDYVEKAIHFMRSEYMLNITVQGLADRLNLDRCYFSVLFKERTGVPPVRYLMQLRMEKAAELMVAYGERASTAGASVA
jgi:hypothetical protein